MSQIPSVDDLPSGRVLIDALRPVVIEDLLGRDPLPPVQELLGPGIRDPVVCVTGAGGSIGLELCRQIPAFAGAIDPAGGGRQNGLMRTLSFPLLLRVQEP